jgi:hypothetical protein
VLGDLNGDGVLDLVVANSGSDDVSVLIAAEDGSFAMQQRIKVGDEPSSMALGDVNDDGVLDLTVSNRSSDDVSLLFGSGNGSFGEQQRIAVGDAPFSITLGDVNGDGTLDLLIVNSGSDNVSLLLNDGGGVFQAQQRISVGEHPGSMALGDVDGDNVLDFVIATEGLYVEIYLGNGDGSFHLHQSYSLETQSVMLADINNDDALDVIAAGADGVSMLLGNSDGSFDTQQYLQLSNVRNSSMVIDDIDSDGVLDLVISNGQLFYGNGDGSFASSQHNLNGSIGNSSVAFSDLNRDGVLDMVVAHNEYRSVTMHLGNGDGSFRQVQDYYLGSHQEPTSVVFDDLNEDGVLDMTVAIDDFHNEVGGVSVLLGNGDGSFQTHQHVVVGGFRFLVELADINNDGVTDLVYSRGVAGDVSVMLGNGDGSFQAEQLVFSIGFGWWEGSLALGDLDSDDNLDLVITNLSDGYIVTLLGNGDGSFQLDQRIDFDVIPNSNSDAAVALGDVNGDDIIDITHSNGELLLGNGDGSFQPRRRISSGDDSIVIGDINRDGAADLVFYGQGILLVLGNGDGTFQEEYHFGISNVIHSMVLADLNGSGRLDMVGVTEIAPNSEHWYLSNVWVIPGKL